MKTILAISLLTFSCHSFAITKCVMADGKVIFTDTACPTQGVKRADDLAIRENTLGDKGESLNRYRAQEQAKLDAAAEQKAAKRAEAIARQEARDKALDRAVKARTLMQPTAPTYNCRPSPLGGTTCTPR